MRFWPLDIKPRPCFGKTPRKILAVRPMKDGVIADFEIAEGMIKALIKRVTPAVASSVQKF